MRCSYTIMSFAKISMEDVFMRDRIERFMIGRYGNDQLNRFFLVIIIGLLAGSIFTHNRLLSMLATVFLILSYYRMLSRNIQKRYEENRKFLNYAAPLFRFLDKQKYRAIQRKNFHIYTCPECRQKIRIPRGKGRIEITCPKCKHKFEKIS